MSKRRKVIIFVIIGLLVLFVGGGMLRGRGGKKGNTTTVRTEKATVGDLTEFVSAPGEVEARKSVEISAKVSARVLQLPYHEGDTVTAGDPTANPPVPASVLVRLDSKDLESQLAAAQASYNAQAAQLEADKARLASQQADLTRIDATLEQASKDFSRQKGLLESHDISEQTYDQAKVRVDELTAQRESMLENIKAAENSLLSARHQLEAAQARIDQAKDALSYTTIVSPIDGTVTRINAEVGEMVVYGTMNNPGTVIMEVADLSQMIVAAQADEMDIAKIKVGQKARVHIQAYPEVVFDGEVISTALAQSMTATAQRGGVKFYRTEVLIDTNDMTVCSGFNADVDIETTTYKDVIKVPSQAILSREVESLPKEAKEKLTAEEKKKTYTTVVFRVMEGKAVATPVKMGASDMTHTIITSGLTADDKVITGPFKVLEQIKNDEAVKEEEKSTNKKEPAEKKEK